MSQQTTPQRNWISTKKRPKPLRQTLLASPTITPTTTRKTTTQPPPVLARQSSILSFVTKEKKGGDEGRGEGKKRKKVDLFEGKEEQDRENMVGTKDMVSPRGKRASDNILTPQSALRVRSNQPMTPFNSIAYNTPPCTVAKPRKLSPLPRHPPSDDDHALSRASRSIRPTLPPPFVYRFDFSPRDHDPRDDPTLAALSPSPPSFSPSPPSTSAPLVSTGTSSTSALLVSTGIPSPSAHLVSTGTPPAKHPPQNRVPSATSTASDDDELGTQPDTQSTCIESTPPHVPVPTLFPPSPPSRRRRRREAEEPNLESLTFVRADEEVMKVYNEFHGFAAAEERRAVKRKVVDESESGGSTEDDGGAEIVVLSSDTDDVVTAAELEPTTYEDDATLLVDSQHSSPCSGHSSTSNIISPTRIPVAPLLSITDNIMLSILDDDDDAAPSSRRTQDVVLARSLRTSPPLLIHMPSLTDDDDAAWADESNISPTAPRHSSLARLLPQYCPSPVIIPISDDDDDTLDHDPVPNVPPTSHWFSPSPSQSPSQLPPCLPLPMPSLTDDNDATLAGEPILNSHPTALRHSLARSPHAPHSVSPILAVLDNDNPMLVHEPALSNPPIAHRSSSPSPSPPPAHLPDIGLPISSLTDDDDATETNRSSPSPPLSQTPVNRPGSKLLAFLGITDSESSLDTDDDDNFASQETQLVPLNSIPPNSIPPSQPQDQHIATRTRWRKTPEPTWQSPPLSFPSSIEGEIEENEVQMDAGARSGT